MTKEENNNVLEHFHCPKCKSANIISEKVSEYTGGGYAEADAAAARIERKLGTGGDVGSSHMHWDLSLSAADKIAPYVWSSDGGTSFVLQEGTFSVKRIG